MTPLHLSQRGKERALCFGDIGVTEQIATIEGRVTQRRVDEGQHFVLGRRVRWHSCAGEERLRARTPVERGRQDVGVIGDQNRQTRDLTERLTEVALPERQRVDLALLLANALRRYGDLERVAVH